MDLECLLPKAYMTPQGLPKTLPRELPRVYYIAHPEDAERYRDEIAKDLWGIQHCRVFYDADPAHPDALEERLSQMQLAVFVITADFLEDDACVKAFEQAKQLHVPILPIKKVKGEEQIDDRFNERCGNYQLLWMEDPDPTVEPYEGKLKSVLDRVFLQDEQLEGIRQAFSPEGPIFLSYRKKNRALAQKLMKTIHDLDGRDNISIWYDEALLPGEEWDKEIETQLENSPLMALAVTPDIFERDENNVLNYVLREEYPRAKKRGLPILPVIMHETSRDDLERESIDGVVQPRDAKMLDKGLEKIFGKAKDTKQDPYHLGLAYLNGAYVEVDRERGCELLRMAADRGKLSAIEALADMYATGNGVKIDYEESVKWREKALKQCGNHRDKYDKCLYHLMLLGFDCYAGGDMASAEKRFEEAAKFYHEKLSDIRVPSGVDLFSPSASELLTYILSIHWMGASAHERLAYVLIQKSAPEFARAEEQLKKAYELQLRILKETERATPERHAQAGRMVVETLNKMDFLYGRWEQALTDEGEQAGIREKARDCTDQAEKWAEEFPGSAADEIKLRRAQRLLTQGEIEQASRLAEEVLERCKERCEACTNPRERRAAEMNVVLTYITRIETLIYAGDFGAAARHIDQAKEINGLFAASGEMQARKYEKHLEYLANKVQELEHSQEP